LEKAWADVRKESEKKTNLDKEIEKQTAEIEEQEKALKKLTDQYDKLAAKNKALGSQKGALTNSKSAKESRRNEVLTQMTTLEGQKGGKTSAEYKALS
jgi:septal ring factor EnvC (AmiA/AmiB activator)